jgi:hypothetical protein
LHLPTLALPVDDMDDEIQKSIAVIIKDIPDSFKLFITEVILSEKKELTFILSKNGRPTSVFLGSGNWSEKIIKLQKLVNHLSAKNRIPSVVNLTNAEKVVVKFGDKI